ncbi:MAG: glycosyltransferase family 39 protein [Anaerolineales bacterium]|nr:glycosyltransferase family 39 protein [Anaerolineales bacterium]
MKTIPEKKQMVFLVLLISGIIASIYWRVIFFPFISDDWWFLRQIQSLGLTNSLQHSFNPNGKTVYAPLGEAFMALMYKIFGFDSVPMRFPNLLIHVVNSLLIVFIMDHILENKWVGYLSGIVYASAIAVHLDVFAWAWATYGDMGGTLFFFLSIWLYLKDKTWLSAFSYLLGSLFKPTIIFLPALLLLHSLILPREKKVDLHPDRLFIKWLPFLAFGGLLTGLKLLGGMPTAYHEDQPYFMDFWGRHLVTNTQWYLTWMFQSIFPVASLRSTIYKIIAGVSTLTFLAGSFASLLAIKRDSVFRQIVFLSAWLAVGLLTVIFLPNHTYRYYSIYSLPAFIALFFYSVHYFFRFLKFNHKIVPVFFLFMGFFAVLGSAYQSHRIFDEKLRQSTFADGTNMLIRRAATAELVIAKLQKDFPTLPPGFVIVLGNADLGAFSNNSAIHYLYDDDTIDLYPPSAISYENGDWHVHAVDSDPQYLDPSLVAVYELEEESIVRTDLFDLLEPSIEP